MSQNSCKLKLLKCPDKLRGNKLHCIAGHENVSKLSQRNRTAVPWTKIETSSGTCDASTFSWEEIVMIERLMKEQYIAHQRAMWFEHLRSCDNIAPAIRSWCSLLLQNKKNCLDTHPCNAKYEVHTDLQGYQRVTQTPNDLLHSDRLRVLNTGRWSPQKCVALNDFQIKIQNIFQIVSSTVK